MAELEAAQRHLSNALQRLQAALEGRSPGTTDLLAPTGEQRDDLTRHVGVLRSECDRLSAALNSIQELP